MRDLDWKILYELYRTPNITKVADKLYMSQPTLTKRLQSIEDEFGTRVVNRSTKGISFTEEGIYLAKQAQTYLQFRSGVDHQMEHFQQKGVGTVRIASAVSFGQRQLPALIREFRQSHPYISFDVQSSRSARLTEYLQNGTVDLAFVRGTYDSDLWRKCLLTDTAYVVSRTPLDLSRLPEYPAIKCIYSGFTNQLLKDWWIACFGQLGTQVVTVEFMQIALEMVLAGIGYCIIFEEEEFLKDSGLWYQPITMPDGSLVQRDTWLVYSNEKPKSPAATEFIRFIEQSF